MLSIRGPHLTSYLGSVECTCFKNSLLRMCKLLRSYLFSKFDTNKFEFLSNHYWSCVLTFRVFYNYRVSVRNNNILE